MTDRDALLAAVVESPDGDLPRLVYADWLEEYGHTLVPADRDSAADRVALIRTQVEQARVEPYSPAYRTAEQRAAELVQRHYADWTRHLPEWVIEAEFVRGFVGRLTVEADRFFGGADAVFEAEPVREVRATRFVQAAEWESLERFFDSPRLRQVTALEFTPDTLVNVEFDALASSPQLDGLERLSLRGNPVPPRWLTDVLAGPRLPGLTGLDLSDVTNVGPATADGLCQATQRRLTRLDLSGVRFTSSDLKRLLGSPCLAGVEELRLKWVGNPANPGPLAHLDLAWVIPWERLRVLDLSGQGLGLDGVKEIAWTPKAARLRWLGLASNGLGRGGAWLLADSPHLNLFYLDVRDNELRARDVDVLRRRFPDAVVVA